MARLRCRRDRDWLDMTGPSGRSAAACHLRNAIGERCRIPAIGPPLLYHAEIGCAEPAEISEEQLNSDGVFEFAVCYPMISSAFTSDRLMNSSI